MSNTHNERLRNTQTFSDYKLGNSHEMTRLEKRGYIRGYMWDERTKKEKRVDGKGSINNLSNSIRETTAAALMELDLPVQILLQATDPNRDAQLASLVESHVIVFCLDQSCKIGWDAGFPPSALSSHPRMLKRENEKLQDGFISVLLSANSITSYRYLNYPSKIN